MKFPRIGADGLRRILAGCVVVVLSGCLRAYEPLPVDFGPLPYLPPVEVKPLEFTPPPPDPPPAADPAPDESAGTPVAWPIQYGKGQIISPFGNRRRTRTGRTHVHQGVDIKAPTNTPVLATANGVVKQASSQRGYGKVVVIDHQNGFETAYAHLNSASVHAGDVVKRGDIIGKLGTTGNATTPHVHYEIRLHGKCVDPADYLQ